MSQKKSGQTAIIYNTLLPKKGDWELLSKIGVTKNPESEDNSLFVKASLPKGWKIIPEKSSSYYTYLVDDKGLRRASIFFKNAFYDRDAFFACFNRFSISTETSVWDDDTENTRMVRCKIFDHGRNNTIYLSPYGTLVIFPNGEFGLEVENEFFFYSNNEWAKSEEKGIPVIGDPEYLHKLMDTVTYQNSLKNVIRQEKEMFVSICHKWLSLNGINDIDDETLYWSQEFDFPSIDK